MGLINSLDYIKKLGFNAIAISPLFDSTGGTGGIKMQSTGYYCTNYFKIDPRIGTEEMVKEFILRAHDRNMHVLMGVSFSHNGGVSSPSPEGHYISGSNPIKYPNSLPYIEDVIRYWTDTFSIDGWILDQGGQLVQNGHNYVGDIAKIVKDISSKAKDTWGRNGFFFAEYLGTAAEIQAITYAAGVNSSIDYPTHITLMQVL